MVALYTADSIHAIYITSVIFPCYGSPQNTRRCTQQFFEGPFLSEKKTLSLCAVIANLCQSIYKCPHTYFKRYGFEFKAVRDMNEVQYDRGKYTDPYVNDLCIRILHFV